MKLKITITGQKVHDVGYRPWLVELAMSMSLRGFDVYNDEEKGQQAVIALIEADDQRIKKFLNTIKINKPQLAEVGNITSEDYADDVMPLWQTATINTNGQINKAIPILQAISNSNNLILENVKDLKTGQDSMLGKLDEVRADVVGEIRELRGDLREVLQPGLAAQLRQLQADFKQLQTDVRAIKEQRGIP